jgi:hypothetical protein
MSGLLLVRQNKNNPNRKGVKVGQAKLRKMNGTYGKSVARDNLQQPIYIDPSVSLWEQPNTPEVRSRLISVDADWRKSGSYHESGHAVFFELAGISVQLATAVPIYDAKNGWSRGAVQTANCTDNSQIRGFIQAILAGDLAQEKAGFGDPVTESDQEQLQDLITNINTTYLREGVVAGFTIGKAHTDFVPRVKRKLDDPQVWAAIESLAARLRESEVVQGDEVREIVTRWCPRFAKAA